MGSSGTVTPDETWVDRGRTQQEDWVLTSALKNLPSVNSRNICSNVVKGKGTSPGSGKELGTRWQACEWVWQLPCCGGQSQAEGLGLMPSRDRKWCLECSAGRRIKSGPSKGCTLEMGIKEKRSISKKWETTGKCVSFHLDSKKIDHLLGDSGHKPVLCLGLWF